jgi:hypothetical protein
MKKLIWIAAATSALALVGASTFSFGATALPKGATAIRAGITYTPVNPRDQALVKNGHLVPVYNFLTMEQCNAFAFCTCFMSSAANGVTCYTTPVQASAQQTR